MHTRRVRERDGASPVNTTIALATDTTGTIGRLAALADQYDADLIGAGKTVAAAATLDDMRAYLRSRNDTYADSDNTDAVRAAFTGRAIAVTGELARMAERLLAGGAR